MGFEVYGVALVPLIIGIVELAKVWGLSTKWSSLLAVVLGLVGGFLVAPGEWIKAVVVGLAMGLSASGLYSGAKNIHQAVAERKKAKKHKKNEEAQV